MRADSRGGRPEDHPNGPSGRSRTGQHPQRGAISAHRPAEVQPGAEYRSVGWAQSASSNQRASAGLFRFWLFTHPGISEMRTERTGAGAAPPGVDFEKVPRGVAKRVPRKVAWTTSNAEPL